jgi:hypothetical protein
VSAPVPVRRPFLLGELAVVGFLLAGYDRVARAAAVDAAAAERHGAALLSLERALHLAVELPVDRALAAHSRLGQVLSLYYDLAHATVTAGALLVLYVAAAGLYRRARTALVLVNAAALLTFLALPVAPPRLLPGAGFVDVVAGSGTWGAWEAGGSELARHADAYASLPSLHVGWAAWVLLATRAATGARWARAAAGLHLALTVVIVVATGNHYLLDVAAGALLAVGAWHVTAGAGRRAAGAARLAAGAARRAAGAGRLLAGAGAAGRPGSRG